MITRKARISEETEIVWKMEKDFLATIKQSRILTLRKKELLIRKKCKKTMHILTKCKKHDGPISVDDINLLDTLDEKSLQLEISYLRATIAPIIRQQPRVKLPDGKFKFLKYSISELKTSIWNAIKLENDRQDDVDRLKSVLD